MRTFVIIGAIFLVMLTGIAGAVAFLSHPGTQSTSAPPPACPVVPAVLVGAISVPAGPVAGYCQDKLVNAAHIMNAARSLGIGQHTQAIAVMTAMGESGLRNIAYGDSAGPDSRGLFQQRANGSWGTLADRMDPYTAARNFFVALVRLPGWKNLGPTQAAHAVQANQDPNYYTPFWPDAVQVVTRLSTK